MSDAGVRDSDLVRSPDQDEERRAPKATSARSTSLALRVWAAVASVALVSVAGVALVFRTAFRKAFSFYLAHQGMMGGPRGPGIMMLGATEREFQTSVDKGILVAALVAVSLSFVVAYFVARAVARPLSRVTSAALSISAGNLEERVPVAGPAEVEELGEAFNEMAESLARAEGLRRRLVQDVAHELRNPVASLRAQIEAIAEGVLPADPKRLASLAVETEHLSRLVTDLQELNIAESGGFTYEMVRVDLSELLRRVAESERVSAPAGVRVVAQCQGALEAVADEGRIVQVLRNMLSNAFRHTPSGEVRVACARDGDRAVITVTDTGEGIPEADLPFIFERFYRADAARARETGGAGIGLAVARRIVRDHGGDVFAKSRPGEGATVGFWLPLAD